MKVTYTADGVHLDLVNLVRQDGGLIVAEGPVAFDRCSDTVTAHPVMFTGGSHASLDLPGSWWSSEASLGLPGFWWSSAQVLVVLGDFTGSTLPGSWRGDFTGSARVLVVHGDFTGSTRVLVVLGGFTGSTRVLVVHGDFAGSADGPLPGSWWSAEAGSSVQLTLTTNEPDGLIFYVLSSDDEQASFVALELFEGARTGVVVNQLLHFA